MEDSPINKAHSFAAAADEYAERHNWSKAVEAHFRAAEQFLLAINYTSDPEATRTLKLMYANHTRQGKELQRRVATTKPKTPTAPLNAGTATTATTINTSSSSTQSHYPTEFHTGSPATALDRRPLSSSTRTLGTPLHSAGSNLPQSPSASAPAKLQQQPIAQNAYFKERPVASDSHLPHNHSTMRPSATSPAKLLREKPVKSHTQSDAYDLFRLRINEQGIERQGESSLIDTEMLMDEEFQGKRGLESSNYTKHGLPNTGHAILPVQSLDASVIQPPPIKRGIGSGIEDSYLVLKGKDEEDEDSDPFNKFWEVVENLVKKISNPVAFATAPLGVGTTGGTTSLPFPPAQYQAFPNGPTPRATPNSMYPKSNVQEYPIDGVGDARHGLTGIMTTAESMPPPTMRSRSTREESSRMSSTPSGHDGRSIAESAYFIVPGQQRNSNASNSSEYQRRVESAMTGRSNDAHLGPGLVNTSQIIMPERRIGASGKTLEEYAIENQQLKLTVDFLSKKVASLERAAEENTMLKSSIYQFRQDVSKQAKRIMQSQEIMRSSALGHRTSPENSTVNAHASKQQKRIKELEDELKQARQENEKQSAMMAKYRGKWEKLKEAAKKKRSGSTNLPSTAASSMSISAVQTHTDTNRTISSQQSSASTADHHTEFRSKIDQHGIVDFEKSTLDEAERSEEVDVEGENERKESAADSVQDLRASSSALTSSLIATPKARHRPFPTSVSTSSENVAEVDLNDVDP